MASHSFFCWCWNFVMVCWQAFISSLVMKLDFISQLSSKSTLPFAGLQHMQQCQAKFQLNFCFHALIQMNGTWKMVSTGPWPGGATFVRPTFVQPTFVPPTFVPPDICPTMTFLPLQHLCHL
jgi:hypothetical protein